MKRLFVGLCLVAMVAILFVAPAQAQTFRLEKVVISNLRVVNSDSTEVLGEPVIRTNVGYPGLQGALPDSIRVSWQANAPDDSVKAFLYFQARQKNATSYTSTLVDSIEAGEGRFTLITPTLWNSKDEIGVLVGGQTAGNDANGQTAAELVASLANRLWVRLEYFYTVKR